METEEMVQEKDLERMNKYILNIWTNCRKKTMIKIPFYIIFAFVSVLFHISSIGINIPHFHEIFIGKYGNNFIRKIISSPSDSISMYYRIFLWAQFFVILILTISFLFKKNCLIYSNQSSFYRQSRRKEWEQVTIRYVLPD